MGTITAFAQDNNGYMWIATAEGLHRYDGKYFKVFKHIESDTNSLSDSYITSIAVRGSTIFIGNHLGNVDVLDANTYEVRHIVLSDIDATFDNPVEQLLIYDDQLIIDTDGGGLWQYNDDEKRIRKLTIPKLKDQEVEEMVVHQGELVLLTRNALYSTDLSDLSVLHTSPIGQKFNTLCRYKNGFLIGSKNGLFWRADKGDFRELDLPPKKRFIKIINKVVAQGNEAWIATTGGLVLLQDDGLMRLYRSNQYRPFSLVNNEVTRLFIDKDGILWIGTVAGVSKYAPQLNKFGLLQYFDYQGNTYSNNVYFTYEDRSDAIWLGTLSSGLIKLTAENQIDKIYPKLGEGESESKSVRSMLEDSKGNFWVGTGIDGLFLIDPTTGANKRVASIEQGNLDNNTIRSIYEDSKGRIWIGTYTGLALKDSLTMSFTHYKADKNHKNNSIYQIEEHPTEDKLIIASFRGGLQLFDISSKTFEVWKHEANDSESISNNNLMSLTWVNKDTLLIGTYGGGMNIFDLRTQKFTSITEVDGLINNTVYGVLYEGNGKAWLSTNDGLVRYNMYTQEFINFRPVHYLQSTEYNEGAFLQSKKGYFYFGGVNGLNYFKPQEIKFDTVSKPILFTNISGAFTQRDENKLELSFLKSRLEIDYMSLYYANPEGIRFRHKLEGLDDDWVVNERGNRAVYPRLSPGLYSFSVMAEDEFGNWRSTSRTLSIRVQPPFWQQWWFVTFAVLSTLGLIYGVFRYRTREIERAYKLQLVDSELAALRSQMNPHFIFNSLNSIQYFILKKEPREAYTYLSKFASLMRKILQNSRLKYISVADEVEGLDLYLEMEKMRMDNNLDYSITTVNITDTDGINMPTMLIQPYVENSIIHGLLPKEKNRKLVVTISRENNHLLCTILDNGIGRDASRIMNAKRSSKHTSAGMNLTQKRLKILSEGKGDFDVKIRDIEGDNGEKGTEVKLVVPIIT